MLVHNLHYSEHPFDESDISPQVSGSTIPSWSARAQGQGICGVNSILLLFLGNGEVRFCGGCCEFEVLPRISGKRIDASCGSSSSRFGSSMIVAEGLFLDISNSPGKDGLLLLALFSAKGLGLWSDGEPSFGI